MNQNHYQVLQIARESNELEIKKAYKRLSLLWHPDNWISRSSEEITYATQMFQRVGEAKDVLLDATCRKEFDEKNPKATFRDDFPDDFTQDSNTYEDEIEIRQRVAMERFYRFYIDCVMAQQKKNKNFTNLFISCAIPATIGLMRFQNIDVSTHESTLGAYITLLMFNPDGIKQVFSDLGAEERRLLDSAIAILLRSDVSF